MIKRFSIFIALLFSFSLVGSASDGPFVSASSAVLMVADTGEVVYEKNAHERRGMASTTKIMTALLTAECATDQRVVVTTAEMVNVEGTSMGLMPGDKVTFHDLIYGMLLSSGNDAANTAAIAIDGSTEKFAQRMNRRAAELGMTNTSFVTPSGLDDENHYSTAYDMALLGCCAVRNVLFLEACSSVSAELCYGNEPYLRRVTNHNKLLKSFDGAFGIKTGFTKKSGRCLVSAAERGGVTLVCVTLNAPDDWNDHRKLLEYGFERVTLKKLDVQLPALDVIGGDLSEVSLMLSHEPAVASLCNEDRLQIQLAMKKCEYAPIEIGEVVGKVNILLDGEVVSSSSVVTTQASACITVETAEKPSMYEKIKLFFEDFSQKVRLILTKGRQQ